MSDERFNLGQVFETVAATIPEREAIVWGDRRLSFADLRDRSRRLATYLHEHGLGAHGPARESLAGHESGQDHLGLYLHNCNEYIEGMIGSYMARVAPFNVNYRYVEEELRYLLTDSGRPGPRVPRHLRPDPRQGAALAPPPRAPPAGGRRVGQRPSPRGRRLRGRPGLGRARAAARGAHARRPLHPLHRGHHRHAQGRAVAPARHLPGRHGRPHLRDLGTGGELRPPARRACCPPATSA